MWYFIFYGLFAVYVLFDARRRKNNMIGWGIGTFVAGPVLLPIYFAKRNLRVKEVRTGGTGWNILKNFALLWTVLMMVLGIITMVGVGEVANNAVSDAEKIGVAIAAGLGVVMIGMLWFFPMITALIIGAFIKKSGHIITGPSGKLVDSGVVV